MEESKVWWKSKTLIGIIISILGKLVGAYFVVSISDADIANATAVTAAVVNADSINAAISLGVGAIGDLFAFWGRAKAIKTIAANK